jgi:hypothetical protein
MPKRKRDKKQTYTQIIEEAERLRKHYINNRVPHGDAAERISSIIAKAYGNGMKRRSKKRR